MKSTKTAAKSVEVVITFDTTGSMYPCLAQVRREVEATIKRLHRDIPNIRIGIIAHGDYCDAGRSYVTRVLDLTDDVDTVVDFVQKVGQTGGGDAPECYELVLHEARQLSWTRGATKVVALIGDDVPHGPDYPQNVKKLDWRNELGLLLEAGISVYGIQALGNAHAAPFYQEIAKMTGGFHLQLEQFSRAQEMILAVCYKQTGDEQLRVYEKEVVAAGRMDRGLDRAFGTLLGRAPTATTFKTRDLEAVPAWRFQVLEVDEDCSIKEFVEEHVGDGAFLPGRGFYEFTKPEEVQGHKEIVLQEVTSGDMFTGKKARDILGLPEHGDVKISPKKIGPYRAFIQSTSYNRKLKSGTRFLYEVKL